MTVLIRRTRHVLPTTSFASAASMASDVGQPTPPPAQPPQAQPAVPAQSQSENAPTAASSTNSVNPWGKRAPPKNIPPIVNDHLRTKWPSLGDEAAAASASSSSNSLPYKKIPKGGGKGPRKNKKGDGSLAQTLNLVGLHLEMSPKHNVQYPQYPHRGRGRGMGRGNGRKPPLRNAHQIGGRGLPPRILRAHLPDATISNMTTRVKSSTFPKAMATKTLTATTNQYPDPAYHTMARTAMPTLETLHTGHAPTILIIKEMKTLLAIPMIQIQSHSTTTIQTPSREKTNERIPRRRRSLRIGQKV